MRITILESRLIRKTPQAYGDGVYMMAGSNRPNPRKLSQALMKGVDGLGSLRNRTALLAFFGQVTCIFMCVDYAKLQVLNFTKFIRMNLIFLIIFFTGCIS